jgi:hypothetical protein
MLFIIYPTAKVISIHWQSKTLNTVKSFVIDAEFIKNERNEQVVCSLKKVKSIKAQW